MNKLQLELENCYGIKRLSHTIDFTDSRVFAIYAPNGSMKSSLARTFQDAAADRPSQDKVFPKRTTIRNITDETGKSLGKGEILVIQPYDEEFGNSEKTSTLLVNSALKVQYEKLHRETDAAREKLIKALKGQSKLKRDPIQEVSLVFTRKSDQFDLALTRIESELSSQTDAPYANVPYETIFDEKVIAFLETKDFKTAIRSYIDTYNDLLSKSQYFSKGIFTFYNAATVLKSLSDNGFFKAKHTVRMKSKDLLEISSADQLEKLISAEKEQILSDPSLRKNYLELEKLLTKNSSMRDFEAYISDNPELISNFENIENFKELVWKSYVKANYELYQDFLMKLQEAKIGSKAIEEQAQKEQTQWENVIELFNERFFVPFKLVAKNRTLVILGQEPILSLGFSFEDGGDIADVPRDTLLQVLSTGEKKALYILNLLFEIQARRISGAETLLIVDDIADSFDYKNKYAIIEYLKEIAETACFKQLLLTHNFDFFRTVNSRFVDYSSCLMASKTNAGVTLQKAEGIKNIFINDWKKRFFTDTKKQVATIPFLRNLIEYTKGATDPDYVTLTSILHWRPDSTSLTRGHLDNIYNGLFGGSNTSSDPLKNLVDLIFEEAESCLSAPEGINFANKVVLSIAIRLKAEKYMVMIINDPAFHVSISSDQTPRLLERAKQVCTDSANSILKKVVLMTPENIHLNSFMYEPILDMSDAHLRKLYSEVKALT